MQTICPKCNTLNPVNNSFCGTCGASLKEAKVVQPVNAVAQRPTRKKAKTGVVILLFIVVWLIALAIASTNDGTTPAPKTHSVLDAWIVTEHFVKDRLKAPSTAEFPCCYDDFTTHLGNGRYRIVSYVDSENSFGAMLRTKFVAVVQWAGGDNYRLESLVFDE